MDYCAVCLNHFKDNEYTLEDEDGYEYHEYCVDLED